MKRAKQRKFREPPFWTKFFYTADDTYLQLKRVSDECDLLANLVTGEIGRIDCGIRFIES